MLTLGHIICQFWDIRYHFYADDMYVSFNPEETDKMLELLKCLTSVKDWLANNFLQLNEDKTKVVIVAPDTTASKVIQLSSVIQSKLRNIALYLIITCILINISNHWPAHFFQLRNIVRLRAVVLHSELEMIIHGFISSRLDYCNSIFTCLSKSGPVYNWSRTLLQGYVDQVQQDVAHHSYFILITLASDQVQDPI